MRRAVSLEDYEQMDPVMRSAGQSCTSIPEDDNGEFLANVVSFLLKLNCLQIYTIFVNDT